MDHRRREVAEHVEHALNVHIHHARKFLDRHFPQFPIGVDQRGVVQQQVRRPTAQDGFGPLGDLGVVRDIDDGELVRGWVGSRREAIAAASRAQP